MAPARGCRWHRQGWLLASLGAVAGLQQPRPQAGREQEGELQREPLGDEVAATRPEATASNTQAEMYFSLGTKIRAAPRVALSSFFPALLHRALAEDVPFHGICAWLTNL